MADHEVFFILQDFEGDLWSFSRQRHVWLVRSPANEEAARGVWNRDAGVHSRLRGVTIFDSSGGLVSDFYQVLEDIDLHHGGPTVWSAIRVRGIGIDQVRADLIAAALGGVGVRILPEPGGFAIACATPPVPDA